MKALKILVLLLPFASVAGQEVDRYAIVSAGEEFTSETAVLNWTLGEMVTEIYYSDSLTLSCGFLQGRLMVTSNTDESLSCVLKAYPNPVCDILILETDAENQVYHIFDSNGKVLGSGTIHSTPVELDFSQYPPGVYILMVDQEEAYKIVKN